MGKVEDKILQEIADKKAEYDGALTELSALLNKTKSVQGKMEKVERELSVKQMELETVRYGMSVEAYLVEHASTFNDFLHVAMLNSEQNVGEVWRESGSAVSFDLYKDNGNTKMGTLVLSVLRNSMGEVVYDLVYNRIDTTGRVRAYRDFQMTSGVFEETLDVRRAIQNALTHLLGEPRE